MISLNISKITATIALPGFSRAHEGGNQNHEQDGMAAPLGRAEVAEALPEDAEKYPLGIARGQVASVFNVFAVSSDRRT